MLKPADLSTLIRRLMSRIPAINEIPRDSRVLAQLRETVRPGNSVTRARLFLFSRRTLFTRACVSQDPQTLCPLCPHYLRGRDRSGFAGCLLHRRRRSRNSGHRFARSLHGITGRAGGNLASRLKSESETAWNRRRICLRIASGRR
jgi:hypothetical protein